MSWIYEPARFAVGVALRLAYRVRVEGLENLPREGPLIVACNHVSLVDPLLMGWAVGSVRQPHFLAKEELFRNPVSAWFFTAVGSIPLDRARGGGDASAMLRAARTLREGECLALFPEGTRSKTGVPGRAKPGIGFLAAQTGAVVVPARVWKKFPKLRLRFGRPLSFEGRGTGRQECQAVADRVMEEILKL